MQVVVCPNCKCNFELKANLKYKVNNIDRFIELMVFTRRAPLDDSDDILENGNHVICPCCGYELEAENYKFFGFLSLTALRLVMIIFLIIVIIISIHYAIR